MNNSKRANWRGLLLCGVFLCGAAVFETVAQPTGIARGYLSAGKDGNSATAQAAGEFRIVAANLLWAKVVDHYHHQYMADGGDWAKNVSLLPLLQTIITLDPHFTEAYELMGGTILPHTGREAEGKAVLLQGIANNPSEWELNRELAMLYAWNDHQPQAALPYAQAGLVQAAQVTDDDGFSLHLMTTLCTTLRRQIRDHNTPGSEKWNAQAVSARIDPQPAPMPEARAQQSRPSVSGSARPDPS